ncbi:Stage 0 sporulation protein KA [Fusobacterium polymorphum]|uniref:Oligopeptide ABC superfamily ATP binding cassette transporter binding protein OppA n=1 Tax=Fusobacterium polymorphum ATCC 10953 TaxID=393480 RepID=A5TTQ3_FUSNP|nr:ABC transporter substrate-binding protein [Fusobacterium polymorphum]EDK88278.1 oligopeptide ABC superfamily ATP binding cassette transporter binding protein OppA [Fusobacterium polymorphum ATCC 10953]UTI53851.1 ABC transporter substrate-binding protein [Fusobacterium polymorphum]WRL68392.1 ABC transporter substrate-binding protein [Fusobacterium polymorphum]CKG83302.1 Stage 0 sporulation protein KA [Fusobacterium polymorphum]
MKILKLLSIFVLTCLLFACGENKTEESEKVEQIFYTVMPKQEYKLNPQSYSGNERALLTQLFEGLTELKTEGVRLVSVVDIKHSNDYKEWTFTLRDDLKWSDGEKITANTYLDSWFDSLENSKSDEIYRLFVIKGAEDYYNKKSDRASVGLKVQDNKLIVNLNNPIKNFDEWVSNPIFYPIRKENRDLNLDKKIVNGAFKVSSFTDDEIILERNENYWDNVNTKLKEIKISLVEDEIMAYEMFPRNEIDYFGEPFYSMPFDRLNQVNTLPEKLVFLTSRYWYISIPNENKEKFFDKTEIRKLMYVVSDPEFMGKVILENNSPAIFSHPHPNSDVLNKAKEDFQKIKENSNFNFSETPYVAYFENNNLLEKKLLLSTVKEWIGQFKIPIRVTSNPDSGITFRIEKYLVGTNNMNDLYHYIDYKYGSNIKSDEEFLNNLPVIPLLQEYDTVLSHSNVRGINVSPSGDIYLKYINMQ